MSEPKMGKHSRFDTPAPAMYISGMVIPLAMKSKRNGISELSPPLIFLLSFFATGGLLLAAGPDPEAPARATLEKHCLACHGAARMSGLDLREKDAMLRGGKRGSALTPGKAEDSLLYRAAAHIGDLVMPPGKQQLSGDELKN